MSEAGGAERVIRSTGLEGPSILDNLKERRQQVLTEQVLDLPVPRWDNPTIVVKYKPVEHGYIRRAQDAVKKAPKAKQYEVEVDGNCDILIRGCVGIVGVVDGQEYSLRVGDHTGEPTVFDKDLAEALGITTNTGKTVTAREVVRGLFFTEGDILSASQSVVEFSGYRETEADAAVTGE